MAQSKTNKISVSIGIFAHNEEKNLDRLLKSLQKQKTQVADICQICIISSGSYDKTNQIARRFAAKDKRVVIIEEVSRRGKSAAINHYLGQATGDISVTVSADLRLHPRAIEELSLPFLNQEVGMAGARPKPSNTRSSQIGEEIELLWELHHHISLLRPKCGEMVAFRNIIRSIPKESAVDEATLEVLLKLVGYAIVYVPRSIVYNKGPLNIQEFLAQRRRVFAGHQWVKKEYNYQVVTMQPQQIIKVILTYLVTHPSKLKPMARLIYIEILARVFGWIDFNVLNKNPFVWKMISR